MLAFDETFTGDETLQNLLTETGKAHGLPVEGLSAFIKDMDTRMAANAAEQQRAQEASLMANGAVTATPARCERFKWLRACAAWPESSRACSMRWALPIIRPCTKSLMR